MKKDYLVFDSIVFVFKNSLFFLRPLFFTALTLIIACCIATLAAAAVVYGGSYTMVIMGIFKFLSDTKSFVHDFGLTSALTLALPVLVFAIIGDVLFNNYGLRIYQGLQNQKQFYPDAVTIFKAGWVCVIRFTALFGVIIVWLLTSKFLPQISAHINQTGSLILWIVAGCILVGITYRWFVKTTFASFAILDGGGILESLSRSYAMTNGRGWVIIGYLLTITFFAHISVVTLFFISPLARAYLYSEFKK